MALSSRYTLHDLPAAIGRTTIEAEKEKLIRQYAAGEITWRTLRERGIGSYLDVLAGLGQFGLRPPIAPMEGPNVAARQRGIALLRQASKTPMLRKSITGAQVSTPYSLIVSDT